MDGPARSARVFESSDARADRGTLADLVADLHDVDLAAPPVILPDFHHKRNMETPSSVAIATRDTIRPTLTSSSLNCGMALLALDLERPNERDVEQFYRQVKDRFPFPRTNRRDLTADDVVQCAIEGGDFAAERFGVDSGELERVEERGRVDIARYGDADRIRRQLPRMVVELSRLRFGSIGPSNHFIEMQEVEEVFAPEVAAKLGVAQGQVTVQYHGGGGVLTGELGHLFGRRRDFPRPLRMQMAIQKPLHHLASAKSFEQLRQRLDLYFTKGCPPVPQRSDEGERLLLANAFAMNYGFAFRLATYSWLREFSQRAFGPSGMRLVVDSPHNSIYEEEVGGRPAVVHRHNAARAFTPDRLAAHPTFAETGQAILLPGTHRTSSYLCVASGGAHRTLHSACHGAGTVVQDFVTRGISGPDPRGRATLRFRYSDAAPARDPHHDDRGIDEAVRILVDHDVLRPVARLRPFAVLN
ncbi:MAG TPA: RtcB family protein [Acidimicrobiia bacterium]|nr:RtcB family protein [Acidimicrobiia bacterium]